jgi:hypothetical protein
MISLKVLSTAAAIALLVPALAPAASFAQAPNTGRNPLAGRPVVAAPVAGVRAGAGGAPRMGSVNIGGGAPGPRLNAGGAPGPRFSGGSPGPRFTGGAGGAPSAQFSGGGGYRGSYAGSHHHHRGGGFIPGAVAGAVIGGAIASQGYYGGPGYYYGDAPAPAYYDDQYYDDSATVAAVPEGGDDAAYCIQRYRSYDPQSGTYLGNDGYRHPCP